MSDLEPIDPTIDIFGPYGSVKHVPYPNPSECKSPATRASIEVGRGTWLISAPSYHPIWSQYVMSIVSLEDHPALGPAFKKFDGATHELLVLAIDPDHPQTVETVRQHCLSGKLPYLKPVNIAEQFECTDDEIRRVCWLAAMAVVNGQLNPETSDAPSRIREGWLTSCTKTLAHIRGEAHSA